MRTYLLGALGGVLLAGCANPVDKIAQSVETVSLASVKYPIKLADWTVQKSEEERQQQRR